MEHSKSPKQLSADNNAIEADSGNLTMAPPAFSLTASSADGNTKDGKPAVKNAPAAPKTRLENGPLSAKDGDDTHAFAQDDVRQGQVEDCWFMAAVAAIAKSHPDILANLIQDNGDGTYTVTLHFPESDAADAKWKPRKITVDRNFPTMKSGKLHAGEPGDQKEIWVMLLEKAYYQELGGVEKVGRALSSDAFAMFTGDGGRSARIRNRPANEEKDAKKTAREQGRYARKSERMERRQARNPRLAMGVLAEPKAGPDVSSIPEYELLGYLQGLLDQGAAVTISTDGWEGRRTIQGFEIYAPHVYTIKSIDQAAGKISLLEPSGKVHLDDLPLKLLRKHFADISYLNLK